MDTKGLGIRKDSFHRWSLDKHGLRRYQTQYHEPTNAHSPSPSEFRLARDDRPVFSIVNSYSLELPS